MYLDVGIFSVYRDPPVLYYSLEALVPHLRLYVSQEIATKIATVLANLSKKDEKRAHIEEMYPAASTLGDMTYWIQHSAQMGIRCHRPPPTNCHSLHVTLQVRTLILMNLWMHWKVTLILVTSD